MRVGPGHKGPHVTEVLSVDWMRALADSLSVHFPQFVREPYFEECFAEMVEERHAEEALVVFSAPFA